MVEVESPPGALRALLEVLVVVVRVWMWPKGIREQARLLSTAALDFTGVALRDDLASGVVQGERAYRVRLFKDREFGGPGETDDLQRAKVWMTGSVRGHLPGLGRRGVWDLLGGSLKVILGSRLSPYVAGGVPASLVEEESEASRVADWLDQVAEGRPADTAAWYRAAANFVRADHSRGGNQE